MILGGAIDFIPHHRMAGMGEMHANLVHTPGLGECADEGERAGGLTGETVQHLESGTRASAGGVDALLEIDAGRQMDALAEEGGVDGELIGGGPAPDDGGVLLGDAALLHEHAEMAGGSL